MIVYALLKCESKKKFERQKSDGDNWYRLLLNQITSKCSKADDIKNNQLKIISFNYDISLDYYLRNRLSNIGFFEDVIVEFLTNHFPLNKEHHLYGKLHSEIETLDSHEFSGYGFKDLLDDIPYSEGDLKNNLKSTILLFNSHRLVNNIETIDEIKHENPERRDEISEIITDAENLYIIGFGFDSQNQGFLGFPKSLAPKLGEKNIYWLNWDGKYKSLTEDLHKRVEVINTHLGNSKLILNISNANKIEDAWQDDFSTRLNPF